MLVCSVTNVPADLVRALKDIVTRIFGKFILYVLID
jgi:hypothetical protein